MGMSKDEVIKGIIHHKLKEKSMQELNHDECFDCSYRPDGKCMCESIEPLLDDALALLKDRAKDYEAWAKEIGADTCVNCRHASFNRNDGKSTCPIEHNFALVKDGFCHLFMRMEGR